MTAYLLEVYTTTSGLPERSVPLEATCNQHAMMLASGHLTHDAQGLLYQATPDGLVFVDRLGLVSQP